MDNPIEKVRSNIGADTKPIRNVAVGAIAAGVFDGTLEAIYNSNPGLYGNKFPFMSVHPKLPPVDDWVVALVPTGVMIGGAYARKPGLASAGLGGAIYGAALILKDLIVRNLTPVLAGMARKAAAGSRSITNTMKQYEAPQRAPTTQALGKY